MHRVSMIALVGAAITFMAGLFATLLGFRLLGRLPAPDPLQEQRMDRSRRLFRVFGPALMVFAVALLFLEPPAQPREWQTVTTSDGVCSVEMPGKPAENEGPILKGLPREREHRLVQDHGEVQYNLAHADIAESYRDLPPEKLLQVVGETWLTAARQMGETQRVSERKLSEKGEPGKEIVVDIDSQRMQQKWFVVNKRLYRAIVSTPRDDPHLQDARRFLESFHIVKKRADKGS